MLLRLKPAASRACLRQIETSLCFNTKTRSPLTRLAKKCTYSVRLWCEHGGETQRLSLRARLGRSERGETERDHACEAHTQG